MKKFIICVCALILVILWAGTYYNLGFYIDLNPNAPVSTFADHRRGVHLYGPGRRERPFEIRGVDLGVGIPGEWATDFSIDKENLSAVVWG